MEKREARPFEPLIIEEIRRREQEQRKKEERPQQEIEEHPDDSEDVPFPPLDPEDDRHRPKRGVEEIQVFKDKEDRGS
ncbi:hypothetical protein HY628_01625 [Candidatus Uhrbacteria bacterium]|nr:hypothetical protein [Candidatus Uhrbacteria bacterium]